MRRFRRRWWPACSQSCSGAAHAGLQPCWVLLAAAGCCWPLLGAAAPARSLSGRRPRPSPPSACSLIAGVGFSNLEGVDLHSERNIFILGFGLYSGAPRLLSAAALPPPAQRCGACRCCARGAGARLLGRRLTRRLPRRPRASHRCRPVHSKLLLHLHHRQRPRPGQHWQRHLQQHPQLPLLHPGRRGPHGLPAAGPDHPQGPPRAHPGGVAAPGVSRGPRGARLPCTYCLL